MGMGKAPSYFALWLFCMTTLLLIGLDEASGRCLESQKALLVKLNQSMLIVENSSSMLSEWNSSSDCCDWPGVTCNNNGYVTGLNLADDILDFGGATSSGLGRLVNLMFLDLFFIGRFPIEISNLTRLVSLHISTDYDSSPNPNLSLLVGNLSNLLELRIFYVNLTLQGSEWSQVLPSSLPRLQELSLIGCGLSGPIHASFQNLTSLSFNDLSHNELSGPFPDVFSSFKNLTYLNLAYNEFSGRIPESLGELKLLSFLDASSNNLEGYIPKSFIKLTGLFFIHLSNNNLSGPVPLFSMFKNLEYLQLQENRFTGSLAAIDWSELSLMKVLHLSHNNLNGTLQFDMLQPMKNLEFLDISFNNLSINVTEVSIAFPLLTYLSLSSCKLKAFPKLIFNSEPGPLEFLDLSLNQMTGLIPEWTRNVHSTLILSSNQLRAFETPLQDYQGTFIMLNSNKLRGNIPNMPSALYVDLSGNLFESSTFSDGNNVNISAGYLSLANNSLRGRIPESMCHFASKTLDLSNNFLSGEIPRCLVQQTKDLLVLNMANNAISGVIPNSFPLNCSLYYLNLNGNKLHGGIPLSLGRCRGLEILDLGNNKLQDVFPCWMRRGSPSLKVLVLRSNLFYGNILCSNVQANWKSLQVMDIASNNFNGSLPSRRLTEWMAMITNNESKFLNNHLLYYISHISFNFRTIIRLDRIKISVTLKGTVIRLEKIPLSFTMIDFSANAFQGSIPIELGYLKDLRSLNISYNRLTGQIPTSLGNMQNLETLDLRNNALTGRIPVELSSLNTLAVLNLSFNQLEGMIPKGPQFQTFEQYSFLHNKGLCGFPLTTSCREVIQNEPSSKSESKFELGVLISTEVGFALGLGLIIMPLVFWSEWRKRFDELTDKLFCK